MSNKEPIDSVKCSYCDTPMLAEIVTFKKPVPEDATDLDLTYEGCRGVCPRCNHRSEPVPVADENDEVVLGNYGGTWLPPWYGTLVELSVRVTGKPLRVWTPLHAAYPTI